MRPHLEVRLTKLQEQNLDAEVVIAIPHSTAACRVLVPTTSVTYKSRIIIGDGGIHKSRCVGAAEAEPEAQHHINASRFTEWFDPLLQERSVWLQLEQRRAANQRAQER
jgi:hypothetical protein